MTSKRIHLTGPEHYREAERLLSQVGVAPSDPPAIAYNEMGRLAAAQVHATLALAAAVAGLNAVEGPGGGSATGRLAEDGNAWAVVLEGGARDGE